MPQFGVSCNLFIECPRRRDVNIAPISVLSVVERKSESTPFVSKRGLLCVLRENDKKGDLNRKIENSRDRKRVNLEENPSIVTL